MNCYLIDKRKKSVFDAFRFDSESLRGVVDKRLRLISITDTHRLIHCLCWLQRCVQFGGLGFSCRQLLRLLLMLLRQLVRVYAAYAAATAATCIQIVTTSSHSQSFKNLKFKYLLKTYLTNAIIIIIIII